MILSSKEIRKRLGIAIGPDGITIDSGETESGLFPPAEAKIQHIPTCANSIAPCREPPNFRLNPENQTISDFRGVGREIRHRQPSVRGSGSLVIDPYHSGSQQPASYDLRAADAAVLSRATTALVPSLEWVELPCDLAATLRCRSSYGRRGIILTGGFVDPGFRGQLTLSLINMGPEEVHLTKGDRVVQMILHQVCEGADLYQGRYQDSHGAVEAR